MNRLVCSSLAILALIVGHATADTPVAPCFHTPPNRASLALIDDTALLFQNKVGLRRPDGPEVTYVTTMDAHDMGNHIMQRLARYEEARSVMLSSHQKTLTVTCDMLTQKIVLEMIVAIENLRPQSKSVSIVDAVHESARTGALNQ